MSYLQNNIHQNIFLENKDRNTYETANRKIILQSKPLKLGIIVSDWCNIHCIMCPDTRNKGSSVLSPSVLSKINDLLPYLERIDWQGGEFFHVGHMKEMFLKLKDFVRIKNVITTNGLLLDTDWIEILLELNSELVFSIDSPHRETYEYIRHGASFDSLIEKLELIKKLEERHKRGLTRGITVVVMKSNYRHLSDFIPFLQKYGFTKINFNPLMFLDNEENIFKNPDVQYLNETMLYLKKTLCGLNIECGWNLPAIDNDGGIKQKDACMEKATFYCNFPFNRISNYLKKKMSEIYSKNNNNSDNSRINSVNRLFLSCVFPWQMLWFGVDRGGNIFPNCWCVYPIGNIFRDNLLEVWNNEKMQQYRKNIAIREFGLCNRDCIKGYTANIHRES